MQFCACMIIIDHWRHFSLSVFYLIFCSPVCQFGMAFWDSLFPPRAATKREWNPANCFDLIKHLSAIFEIWSQLWVHKVTITRDTVGPVAFPQIWKIRDKYRPPACTKLYTKHKQKYQAEQLYVFLWLVYALHSQ